MKNNWHSIDLSQIDTPALLIDKGKVRSNIESAISYAGGTDRLRPHVKTHKMLEIAKMTVAEGIYKYKCATIPEAEMLGMAGATEVLIAYPVQGPKVDRVIMLMDRFPDTAYSILVDHLDPAREIDKKFERVEKTVDVFVDINNGQNRTGINLDHAEELIRFINQLPQINLIGLHCYDGHIRSASLTKRTEQCRLAFEGVTKLRNTTEEILQKKMRVVAGGSPSFTVHARYHDVECSPGTFILWDERYANDYTEQEFQKAAVLATRVISQIDSHTFCVDIGHKSVASEFPFPRVKFLYEHHFTQIGQSEEHLIIKSKIPDVLTVGQVLLAYPYHICPTVALYDHVHVVQNGEIIDQWEVIARNRKITI